VGVAAGAVGRCRASPPWWATARIFGAGSTGPASYF